MADSRLRIVTRESPLAMWQARHVAESLKQIHPRIEVEIRGVSTEADVFIDAPLHSLGGKVVVRVGEEAD